METFADTIRRIMAQPRVRVDETEEPPCPVCEGTGWVRRRAALGEPAFGDLFPCECKRQYAIEVERRNRLTISKIPTRSEPKTFETFNVRPGLEEAFKVAVNAGAGIMPPTMLVLNGDFGVGKTHLLEAVGLASIDRGAGVLFEFVPRMLRRFQSSFSGQGEPVARELDHMAQIPVLILDELAVRPDTSQYEVDALTELIDTRLAREALTVISCNVAVGSDIGETLGRRVASRLKDTSSGNVKWITVIATDYRLDAEARE